MLAALRRGTDQSQRDYQDIVAIRTLDFRFFGFVFLRGSRGLRVFTGPDFSSVILHDFSSQADHRDRFQHSDPTSGALLMRRYKPEGAFFGRKRCAVHRIRHDHFGFENP